MFLTLGSFLTNISAQALPFGFVLQFHAGYQRSRYVNVFPFLKNLQGYDMR